MFPGFLLNLDWTPNYVLDAGANIGLASRIFAMLWPHAMIISLEPDADNFAMLELNAAMASNIRPNNVLFSLLLLDYDWLKDLYIDTLRGAAMI